MHTCMYVCALSGPDAGCGAGRAETVTMTVQPVGVPAMLSSRTQAYLVLRNAPYVILLPVAKLPILSPLPVVNRYHKVTSPII